MSTLLYQEVQTAGPPVFAYIASGVSLTILIIFIISAKRIFYKVLLSIVAIIIVLSILIFTNLKLETIYYTDRIDYQFKFILPPSYQTIYRDSVASMKVIDAKGNSRGPQMTDNGEVYKVSGDKVILITLKSGKTVGLGTRHAAAIKSLLGEYYPIETGKGNKQ